MLQDQLRFYLPDELFASLDEAIKNSILASVTKIVMDKVTEQVDSQLDKIFETYSKIKYARGLQQQNVISLFRKMVSEWTLPES